MPLLQADLIGVEAKEINVKGDLGFSATLSLSDGVEITVRLHEHENREFHTAIERAAIQILSERLNLFNV